MDASPPDYSSTIECHGIRVPLVEGIITPKLQRAMRANRYESSEAKALTALLRPDDRVLDLGSGVGLISAIAAKITGPANVVTIEANPELLPLISETHRLNGAEGIGTLHGVGVARPTGRDVTFHLHERFWASTMDAGRASGDGFVRSVEVPEIDLNALVSQFKPTVLTADIEGGERLLFDDLDTDGLRAISLELHPRVYGRAGSAHIFATLLKRGFVYDTNASPGGSVVVLTRFGRRVPSVDALGTATA